MIIAINVVPNEWFHESGKVLNYNFLGLLLVNVSCNDTFTLNDHEVAVTVKFSLWQEKQLGLKGHVSVLNTKVASGLFVIHILLYTYVSSVV